MKPSRAPTIRTIAEYVELSPTAVSLALRGDDSIPVETRNRVLAAARELNYDFVARRRKTEKKLLKRFVYLVKDYGDHPVSANPFYGHILRGVEQACQQFDASLSFVIMDHNYAATSELPATLLSDVDGVIMAGPYDAAVIDRVAAEGDCPVVLVDNKYPGVDYDTVMADDYGGSYLITEHLIELGHTQIMMVAGLSRSFHIPPSYQERHRGYIDACKVYNIESRPLTIVPAYVEDKDVTERVELYRPWLSSVIRENPGVTAYYGAGDTYAIPLLQTLQALGFRVPHDLSVVGFDDYDICSLMNPPLTTVHSHKVQLGQIAVRQLLSRINGDDMPPLNISVGVQVIRRASSGAAANR
jgi:DNA-binding LacI/PurR family transcriptional regulator